MMHLLPSLLQKHFTEPTKILQIHALFITSGFFLLPNPNQSRTIAFNCLIQTYLRQRTPKPKPPHAPLRLFLQLLSSGAQPNHHTFPSLLKSSSSPLIGTSIHGQTLRRGFVLDDFIGCSLIKFYAQLGRFSDAKKVFDEMPHPDLASCNAMLDMLCACHDMGSAYDFFQSMSIRDIASWTTMISGFSKNGSYSSAIQLFRRLIHEGENVFAKMIPNEATIVSVLSACASVDDREGLNVGTEIHSHIIQRQIHLSAFLGTALIDLYGKHGHLYYCENIFKAIIQKEVCTWNAMISALACNGGEENALQMFERMQSDGVVPNHITLLAVLTACSRAGLVDLGVQHFEAMVSKYGLTPLMRHYGCMVDLFGRAGLLHKAMNFIMQMPFEADESVWGALFGSCKLHGNAELGAYVGQKLLNLEPWYGGWYKTLRNIYAEAGRWQNVVEMRENMILTGAKMVTGKSYVNSTCTTGNPIQHHLI
ncbi:Pentatricopeptide repeat (PPR) superfamily protein [Rhynchospora pubera]|uniref:Pentatricopeptide repeat (PPR) superfamily protein n=2 Tax=Rhynchospora pubera TaxID=906938 RepID=A0AAV8HKP9_9POAL|nr:Pentatricopeptide repeat (PPR) superfamily protein [Rhynchospora pubera]